MSALYRVSTHSLASRLGTEKTNTSPWSITGDIALTNDSKLGLVSRPSIRLKASCQMPVADDVSIANKIPPLLRPEDVAQDRDAFLGERALAGPLRINQMQLGECLQLAVSGTLTYAQLFRDRRWSG